jgi:DNA polymerase-3 subunit gamma/tau
MRDALSVLDQCLSFGEGTITAGRVREVLGVVGDEIYAEVLRLVAERRPAGVFPLVDRLADSGADLAEFMGGTGEALRALLMLQLGAEPEALTEAMRQVLVELRDQLQPGDALRMLRLLGESETALRRSSNPRLEVESLLLRWCMLDRMVDLAEVLSGAPADPRPTAGAPRPALQEPRSATPGRPSAVQEQPPAVQELRPAPRDPQSAPRAPHPATLDAITSAWPDIVEEVRAQSRFLGEALGAGSPTALDPPWVTVTLTEPNPLFAEKLQIEARVVEEVLRTATGQTLRLRVTEAAPGSDSPPGKPRKMSEASIKADRLRSLRAKDPALDTAADSLDLEIVE